MLADRLGKAWEACRASTTIDRNMRFADEGLVLGAGTILARSRGSARDIAIDANGHRLTALLAAAHLRNPSFSDLAHLRKAAEVWSQGDDALAAMHLALSRLNQLREPEADAHRLFLADGLLKSGVPADEIVFAIERGPAAFQRLHKYSADQPRVPAGSGRPSGQWTSGSAGGAAPSSTSSPPGTLNTGVIMPIIGDDACNLARTDCVQHAMIDDYGKAAANDNFDPQVTAVRRMADCAKTNVLCSMVSFGVEVLPNAVRGAAIFPDGGVVVMEKGKEDMYIPRGGRIPPQTILRPR
jgi:hypothetical protein